jgi:hypothetical protein
MSVITANPKQGFNKYVLKLMASFGLLNLILTTFYGLRNQLWPDEAFSAQAIQMGWKDMISLTASDVHPPLHYIYLKTWSSLFGMSPLSLRLSSSLIMALAVAILVFIIWRWLGQKPAIIGGALLSLSPYILRLGLEVRMYSLAILFCSLVMTFYLENLHVRKRSYQILTGVLAALALYTHYYSVFLMISLAIFELVKLTKAKLKLNQLPKEITLILAGFIGIIVYTPWIQTFLAQTAKLKGGFWVPKPDLLSLIYEPINLISGVEETWFNYWPARIISLVLIVVILFKFKLIKNIILEAEPNLKVFISLFAISSLVMFLLSIIMPTSVFYPRYLSLSAFITFIPTLSYILSKLKPKIYFVALAMLLVASNIYLFIYGNSRVMSDKVGLFKDAYSAECTLNFNNKPNIYIFDPASNADGLEYYLSLSGQTNYQLFVREWPSSEPWQDIWVKRLTLNNLVKKVNDQQINELILENAQTHNIWYYKEAKVEDGEVANGYQPDYLRGYQSITNPCIYKDSILKNYLVSDSYLIQF